MEEILRDTLVWRRPEERGRVPSKNNAWSLNYLHACMHMQNKERKIRTKDHPSSQYSKVQGQGQLYQLCREDQLIMVTADPDTGYI